MEGRLTVTLRDDIIGDAESSFTNDFYYDWVEKRLYVLVYIIESIIPYVETPSKPKVVWRHLWQLGDASIQFSYLNYS